MQSRARAFCATWNNYPDNHQDRFDALNARYVCYGYEWAPGTGTPHLQCYIYFDNARSHRSMCSSLPGVHITIARGSFEQNKAYCSKDGDFIEFGTPPQAPEKNGSDERERYEAAWDSAKRGALDEIDAQLRIRFYSAFKAIARDHMVRPDQLDGTCGLWIHGTSGSGKTTSANRAFPGAFLKPLNKWWDGYQGESVVILDDMAVYHRELTTYLKHWADFLPFIAETKGGGFFIRPSKFIVTSQYTIEEIWGEDAHALEALTRRFTVVEKKLGQDIIL